MITKMSIRCEHVGFGVLSLKLSFKDIVCENFSKNNDSYENKFYPDVRASDPNRPLKESLSSEEWYELTRDGVMIGPLCVYKTVEAGVAIEFCCFDDNVDEMRITRCFEWLNRLKEQGRVPKDVNVTIFTWS